MSIRDEDTAGCADSIIGSDLKLRDVLNDEEIKPLLMNNLFAGATRIMITDQKGNVLCAAGEEREGDCVRKYPLSLEGETVGYMIAKGEMHSEYVSQMVHTALSLIMQANMKRMLTTDIHMLVLERSNEELLEINRDLALSEKKYRELSEHLEEKVQERTMELKQAQARLFQQEKLVSIGQLAAGIAHEINNPMGYITSNLNTLKNYMSRSKGLLQLCCNTMQGEGAPAGFGHTFKEHWRELKLDQALSDSDDLILESLEGAQRVTRIVSNLRGMSHVDESLNAPVDINKELDTILEVLKHEISPGTRIERVFGSLPVFTCNPGLLSQVFFNIILNALQSRSKGLEVVVTTKIMDDLILIRISDNGPGIPEDIMNRIFEPFFTTKEVGRGTGLGLTMAYDIVVSHGGTIEVQSKEGTTVEIRLPVRG